MYNRLRSHTGFTIVELLVVIVVISILVTIVTLGYNAYQNNAKRSQIASTIQAYQSAINGITFEKDKSPIQSAVANGTQNTAIACISGSNAACCFGNFQTPGNTAMTCASNSELDGYGYQSSNLYNSIKKYLPNKPPKMPSFSTTDFPVCGPVSLQQTPCSIQEVEYQHSGDFISSGVQTGDSPKGILTYYLPIAYDCESPDTLSYVGSPAQLRYQNAKFTRKITSTTPQYTVCIVGIR